MGRDLSRFVGMCAHMMGQAEQALADAKPKHLYRIEYENMVANPLDELTRLGEFFEFADPAGWAAQVAGRVRPSRTKAAPAAV